MWASRHAGTLGVTTSRSTAPRGARRGPHRPQAGRTRVFAPVGSATHFLPGRSGVVPGARVRRSRCRSGTPRVSAWRWIVCCGPGARSAGRLVARAGDRHRNRVRSPSTIARPRCPAWLRHRWDSSAPARGLSPPCQVRRRWPRDTSHRPSVWRPCGRGAGRVEESECGVATALGPGVNERREALPKAWTAPSLPASRQPGEASNQLTTRITFPSQSWRPGLADG
jgi:hypothetical protein